MNMTFAAGDVFTCWECGIKFGVDEQYVRVRMRGDEEIYCPNGHGNRYSWHNEAKAEEERDQLRQQVADLRRENMQLRHEREQAEARASEGKPRRDDVDSVTETPPAAPPIPVGGYDVQESTAGEWACPVCAKVYRSISGISAHMRKDHFMRRNDHGRWEPLPLPEMPEGGWVLTKPPGQEHWKCPVCSLNYVQNGIALRTHLREKHHLESRHGRWLPRQAPAETPPPAAAARDGADAMPEGGWVIITEAETGQHYCPVCSKPYRIKERLWDHLRNDHKLECLNGHWMPPDEHARLVEAWVERRQPLPSQAVEVRPDPPEGYKIIFTMADCQCPVCGKRYATGISCAKHMERIHHLQPHPDPDRDTWVRRAET